MNPDGTNSETNPVPHPIAEPERVTIQAEPERETVIAEPERETVIAEPERETVQAVPEAAPAAPIAAPLAPALDALPQVAAPEPVKQPGPLRRFGNWILRRKS